MALTKSIIYKGITVPNAYAYIARRNEIKNNNNGEITFAGNFDIQIFTDSTKQYRIEELTYSIPFNNFTTEEISWIPFCQKAYPLAKAYNDNDIYPLSDWEDC